MKKFLIWFGGIALSFVLLSVLLLAYSSLGKAKWDEVSENHARTVVKNFSEFGEEQFNKYWGDNPPGTQEEREAMVKWASRFGVLKTIDSVKQISYLTKVALNGIHRYYVYDAYATYSNSPVRFRFWFNIYGDSLTVRNMTINSVK